jgi:hypothetical protein
LFAGQKVGKRIFQNRTPTTYCWGGQSFEKVSKNVGVKVMGGGGVIP